MKIKEIVLLTSQIDKLKNFYENILEMSTFSESGTKISFKAGTSILTFEADEKYKDPFYHFAFNIPENQLQKSKEWLKKKKIELIKLDGEDEFDFKSWNAHSVYFYDPAGNIVEFIARHNLENSSTENFSGKIILNISEAGMPVTDVKAFYEKLKSEFGIPIYSGDTHSFCAAGDEDGLFIIVPKGRRWFPDCGDAEIFPTEISIESDKRSEIDHEDNLYKIIS